MLGNVRSTDRWATRTLVRRSSPGGPGLRLVAAPDDLDHLQVDHAEAPHLVGEERPHEQRRTSGVGDVFGLVGVHGYSGMRRQPGRRRALCRNMWCSRILIQ